jgi:omega-6 fatty acid desaturase (delta-12 desaturase)
VHHLNPRIPNYYLETCHTRVPEFSNVKPVTLPGSLKSLNYRLWDEDRNELVSFSGVKQV